MDGTSNIQVKATWTSIQILEEVLSRNGAGLTELDDEFDLAKSTIHNHLATLTQAGYLVRDNGNYKPGLKFLVLGEHARNRSPKHLLAKNSVSNLGNKINGEVDFTMEEYGRLVSLYHFSSDDDEMINQSGGYFYLHNTAAGKAILAHFSPDHVEKIVSKWGLPASTDQTITDRNRLLEEFSKIREQGYAVNNQELMEGYCAVSKIAKTPEEEVFGALSAGCPRYEFDHKKDQFITNITEQINELEKNLKINKQPHDNWWQPFRRLTPSNY